MEAVRERWTDDRMDDLVHHVDRGFAQVDARFIQVDARFIQVDARFAQVDARFAEVHDDLGALRSEQIEIRKELAEKATRQELSALQSEMNQRFDKLQNMLLTGFLTLVVTLIATQIV